MRRWAPHSGGDDLTAEDVVWDWTRNPKQDEFVWDRSRFAVWVSGRGGTKTSSGCFRLMTLVQDPAYQGARIALFAPVSKQLKRGPLEKFDEIFEPTGLLLRKVNGHEPRRELAGGITLHAFNVGPQGEGVEATRGGEFAVAWLDEAAQMPEKTFHLANALLRQKNGRARAYLYQMLITTTPRGRNWVWRRFLERPPENACVIRSTTLDSIRAGILDADYVEHMGYLPGSLMHRQEVLGEAVAWAGLVFSEFSYQKCVPDPFVLPEMTHVFGGIDIGTADPTAIELAGTDRQGGVWLFNEYYERRARFDDWGDIAGGWDRQHKIRGWRVDSDLTVKMMRSAGLRAKAPYKAKDAANVAINYINSKIARGEFHVSPKCANLIRELEEYRHKDELTGDEPTILGTIATGQDDHAIDAMRYACLPLSSAQAAGQYGQEVEFAYVS